MLYYLEYHFLREETTFFDICFEIAQVTNEFKISKSVYSGDELDVYADLISGIQLRSQSAIFHIRYLDSNQYAVLCEYDATDVGWIIEGNVEKYYTEEELNEQKRSKEEYINRQSENICVDKIDFADAFDGKEVHILDGISWGCLYVFDISEDMNTIKSNGDKTEYIRDTK